MFDACFIFRHAPTGSICNSPQSTPRHLYTPYFDGIKEVPLLSSVVWNDNIYLNKICLRALAADIVSSRPHNSRTKLPWKPLFYVGRRHFEHVFPDPTFFPEAARHAFIHSQLRKTPYYPLNYSAISRFTPVTRVNPLRE